MNIALELYGARTGNCLRAAIALEEAGLPYAARRVDLRAAAHRAPAFLSLNPAGKVPVLIDRRSGEEVVITQSNAIMMHVAEAVPERLMPATSPLERARFYERYFYFVTDVIAANHAAFQLRASGVEQGSDLFIRRCIAHLEAAQRFLEDGPFMTGERFSIVDIAAVTVASTVAEAIDWTSLPKLKAWYERIAARSSVVRGMHSFDLPVNAPQP